MEAVGGVPEVAGGSGRRCSDIEFKNMVTVNVIGNDGKTASFTRACMEMIQAARTPSMVISQPKRPTLWGVSSMSCTAGHTLRHPHSTAKVVKVTS